MMFRIVRGIVGGAVLGGVVSSVCSWMDGGEQQGERKANHVLYVDGWPLSRLAETMGVDIYILNRIIEVHGGDAAVIMRACKEMAENPDPVEKELACERALLFHQECMNRVANNKEHMADLHLLEDKIQSAFQKYMNVT